MQKNIKTYIVNHQLLNEGDKVIVGVSGGVDSVVLLHLLHALKFKCIVAHCNFSLRNEESNSDEAFVRALAHRLSLPIECIKFDTKAVAIEQKISIEMAARNLRYQWFEQLRNTHKASAIAVAHHADDNIETVLMNLVRGTGLRGTTGIKPRNGNIVRPLLNVSRNEIELFADAQFLNFVTDSTNASNDYTRNKFRNQIIPLLIEINPAFRKTFTQNIQHFNQQYAFYESSIEQMKTQIVTISGSQTCIDLSLLRNCSSPSLLLFEILQPYNFDADVAQQLYEAMDAAPGRLFLSATHTALLDRNKVVVQAIGYKNEGSKICFLNQNEIHSQPFAFEITVFEHNHQFAPSRNVDIVHFDADKLGANLCLEKWQTGDIFVPYGMSGRKKISDFLIDNKINRFEKNELWLLKAHNGDIACLVGYRTDQRFCVDENTKTITELKFKK